MFASGGFLRPAENEHNTQKKTLTYSEQSAEQRQAYQAAIAQIPVKKRVYVDESGINTYLQREYGRALRGKPVTDTKPGRKFQRVNVIGAICNGKSIAIQDYQHKTNAAFFEQWFSDCLLEAVPKGYTVIMDNASFHRKKQLRAIAEKKKVHILFLPPYSPDLNPIEHVWANMKKWIRNNGPFCSIVYAVYAYFILSDSNLK
jgi:transposase